MPQKKNNPQIQKRYSETLRGRYRTLRYRAKAKRRKMTITFHQFIKLMAQPCFYECGRRLRGQGYSLDRLDNKKGYTLNNVVPCCGECNRVRGADLTVEETLYVIRALTRFRKKNRGAR